MRSHLSLVLFAVVLLSVAGATVAQEASETIVENEDFKDWAVRCSGEGDDKRCSMNQTLRSAGENNDWLLRIELNQGQEGTAQGFLVIPFGMDINKGVSMSIDGGARFNLPYRTCQSFGCVVPINFSGPAVEAMKKGETVEVTIYTLEGGSSFNLPVSLRGFTAAFEAL
ncbi:MAG: invasion associated locus B family protein [Pseudomonadota bacterium]